MKEILTALKKAKKQFKKVVKDSRNKGQNFSYASMEAINQAIETGLEDADLTVFFLHFEYEDKEGISPALKLVLIHNQSEQKIESFIKLTPSIMKSRDGREIQTFSQAMAAATTSAKRLLLTSLLNLSIEEDEDGVFNPNEMQPQRVAPPQQQKIAPEKISSEQLLELNKLLHRKGLVNEKFQADDVQRAAASSVIKEVCGTSLARADIPQKHFQALVSKLEAIPDALESSQETEDITKWI